MRVRGIPLGSSGDSQGSIDIFDSQGYIKSELLRTSNAVQGANIYIRDTRTSNDESYEYYGFVKQGNWCIARYDILTMMNRVVAQQSNNSGYSSLSQAWGDRGSLLYN